MNCENSKYWVSVKKIRYAEGGPVRIHDLRIGLQGQAVITSEGIQSLTFTSVQIPSVVRAKLTPRQIRDKYTEGVRIYSKEVFPLGVMEEDYRYSSNATLALKLIQLHCAGIRKCASEGENAFWRVIGIAYMEHLARSSTHIANLQALLSFPRSHDLPLVPDTLQQLQSLKQVNRAGMAWLQDLYHSQAFWSQLAIFLQRFIIRYTIDHKLCQGLFAGDDPALVELFFTQDDYEETALKVISEALSLKIVVYSPEPQQLKNAYMAETEGKRLALIYLFRDMAQYHILYSAYQLEIDKYSLEALSMREEGVRTDDIMEKLYYVTRKRKQLQSNLTRDIAISDRQVKALTWFSAAAQDWICSLLKSIETHQASSGFYTEDIVRSTLLQLQEYNGALLKIHNSPLRDYSEFVRNIMEKLEQGSLQKAFQTDQIKALFQQMRVCDYCHQPGSVILDCTHSFCREHIETYARNYSSNTPLFLKANGETTEDFRCPLLNCFVRISGAKYREIIGNEEYQQHLASVERSTMRKCCRSCRKIRTNEHFQTLCVCNQPICLYCYCTFQRRNEGHCSCGQPLSEEVMKLIKSLTVACASCMQIKLVLTEFTHIECEDHTLCQTCLKNISRGNKRCTVCYRFFSQQEMAEAARVQEKICQFCGRNCSRALLSTDCDCVICLVCAKEWTLKTEAANACFRCNKQLPIHGFNQLIVFLPDPAQIPVTEVLCLICTAGKPEDQTLKLPCNDIFCRDCFEDFVQDKLTSGFSESMKCPNGKCDINLSLIDLLPFLSTTLSNQLNGQIALSKTTPCPRCTQPVMERDENDAKKPTVICRNCSLYFCTSCNLEITSSHNQRYCKFMQIQKEIAMIEDVKAPNEIVAQCPTCKFPFWYSGGCSNVVCKTNGCSTKFCVRCSAPFIGYTTHGKAWHRPECQFYAAADRRGGMSKNCPECMKLGTLCTPPKKLKTPRRFDIDGN